MELDGRKVRILHAIIDEYILSAAPVGSKTLSALSELGVSSATIRNEMAWLEELGYLLSPHTSAGRIPSEKAYRLYVDSMLGRSRLSAAELSLLKNYCKMRVHGVEDVMKETARALSELTQFAAVVLLPETAGNRLRHLQLVPLSVGSAMLITVTDAGTAHSAVIRVPEDMDTEELERISRLITRRYADCTLHTIAERMVVELGETLKERRGFLNSLLRAMERSTAPGAHLVEMSGATKLLQYPEYRDASRAKNFLALAEDKNELYTLLKHAGEMEFTITIGAENDADALSDCSVVTAGYRLGGLTGAIGVIGPTRMPYGKVLTVLDYMRAGLGEVLTHFITEKE